MVHSNTLFYFIILLVFLEIITIIKYIFIKITIYSVYRLYIDIFINLYDLWFKLFQYKIILRKKIILIKIK